MGKGLLVHFQFILKVQDGIQLQIEHLVVNPNQKLLRIIPKKIKKVLQKINLINQKKLINDSANSES